MATSVGQINFGIGIDAGSTAAELRTALAPVLAQVQSQLDRNPLKLKLTVDQTGIRTAVRAAIIETEAAARALKIKLTVDPIGFRTAVRTAIIETEAAARALKIQLDVDPTGFRTRVREAVRDTEASARPIRIAVEVDRRAARDVDGIRDALGGIGLATGVAGGVAAALAAIGGAAGAALGAVSGLAAGLAALGPAVGAISATAVVGFQGIGDTFKALSASTANAAAETRTHTEAVASAQDSLASASVSAQTAQKSLNSAQKDAASAARDVADAYKTAQERLDNYQTTLKEASLDEREARLNLVEAQKELNKATLDPTERERALLRVERAEINLGKAQKANTKLQKQAATDLAKGAAGSKEVVDAKAKQAQADERVTTAAQNLARANQQVAKAAENLAKAQNAALPSVQKFNDQLAQLAPNAQSFVLAARALAPAWEAVRKQVQDNLFTNLGTELTQTANVVLPAMRTGMSGIATELNGAAAEALKFIRSTEGMAGLNAAFASGRDLLAGLRSGTGQFAQGLVDLTKTAAPQMRGIGEALGSIGTSLGKTFSEISKSGQFSGLLTGFQEALRGIGPLLSGLVSGLVEIGRNVLPTLRPLFETLGQTLKDIAPSLGQLGAVFTKALTAILPDLGRFISALAKGLQPVLPVLAQLLDAMFKALGPLVEPLSRFAVILGETLAKAVEQLAPSIGPLGNALADILKAVAPLVPLLAQGLTTAIVALAPALTDVAKALTPVVESFAKEMGPVLKDLAPTFAEMARIVGVVLVDALKILLPFMPGLTKAFAETVFAIEPVLRVTTNLAGSLLNLVHNVIGPVVLPAVRAFGEVWKSTLQGIGASVDFVTGVSFPKLGEVLDKVKGWFSSAVEAIKTSWAGLADAASIPVNFVINQVWNNGLLKAWQSVDNLLGGVLPDASPLAEIPRRATGGPIGSIYGGGNGTKDDILTWLSNGEHVVTAGEVLKAGGQNILFAIRDMIARGIPFTWDNGRIITELGRDNLNRYGAAVAQKGFGNVPPEGLFAELARVPIPQFASGGPIMPWMYQLQKGHDFARAQNGKPYQWAGPTGPGSSFDCSGFMGSIAAAILGSNPWQRYWATGSFNGQQVGPQGFTKNLREGSGFGIGVSNGGPGGGHTAGELRGIPELSIAAARVESGGSIGDVHYGRGTDPNSFQMQYGLPIGANGFFQPGAGGGGGFVGPSTGEQTSFLNRTIERIVHAATKPVRDLITSTIGMPPPSIRGIPTGVLDLNEKAFASFLSGRVGSLGGLLGGAWQKATDLGDRVLDFVNPFDSGGIASGTGFMPKNVISPERVLSPEQTQLFEALVLALQKIAGAGVAAASQAAQAVTVDISRASVDALRTTLGIKEAPEGIKEPAPEIVALTEKFEAGQIHTGELLSDTRALLERTATSQEAVAVRNAEDQQKMLLNIASKLSAEVLGPILSSAVNAGTQFISSLFDGAAKAIVGSTDKTTKAVIGLGSQLANISRSSTSQAAFGAPGSSFDLAGALSTAAVTISNAASAAFKKVGDDIVAAALKQQPSLVGSESRGTLGKDISGGFLTDLIVSITGVEIQVRDLLENTLDEIRKFRGDSTSAFTDTGEIISDTAILVQRNQSSIELAAKEQERIQKALIKAVIKYLIVNVLIPIITAILGAMITLATTAIGAAIGSAIPVIGTAIGAAIGAAVGAALTGLAVVFTSVLAVGAGAALDAFDEGGVAHGVGYLSKQTIAPERVLSPRQTASFERLVSVLDRGGSGSRTVQIASMNVHGRDPAQKTADHLLTLLNT